MYGVVPPVIVKLIVPAADKLQLRSVWVSVATKIFGSVIVTEIVVEQPFASVMVAE